MKYFLNTPIDPHNIFHVRHFSFTTGKYFIFIFLDLHITHHVKQKFINIEKQYLLFSILFMQIFDAVPNFVLVGIAYLLEKKKIKWRRQFQFTSNSTKTK